MSVFPDEDQQPCGTIGVSRQPSDDDVRRTQRRPAIIPLSPTGEFRRQTALECGGEGGVRGLLRSAILDSERHRRITSTPSGNENDSKSSSGRLLLMDTESTA